MNLNIFITISTMAAKYVFAPFNGELHPAKVLAESEAEFHVARVDKGSFDEINTVACAACVRLLDGNRRCSTCLSRYHFLGMQEFARGSTQVIDKRHCKPCRSFRLGFQRNNLKQPRLGVIYNLDFERHSGGETFVYALTETAFARTITLGTGRAQNRFVVEYVLVRPPEEREAACSAAVLYEVQNGVGRLARPTSPDCIQPEIMRVAIQNMPWTPR